MRIAGGFRRGETVLAAKDLRVKGVVVVKANVLGQVVGQSATDPAGRVTVAFTRREDGRSNNLHPVEARNRMKKRERCHVLICFDMFWRCVFISSIVEGASGAVS